MPTVDRSEFLKAIKSAFPDLRADLNGQQGLMGFEVLVLRNAANRAIYDGDSERLEALAALAEVGLNHGNQQVREALLAFFIDDLDLVGRHAWAMAHLPPIVAKLRQQRMSDKGLPK